MYVNGNGLCANCQKQERRPYEYSQVYLVSLFAKFVESTEIGAISMSEATEFNEVPSIAMCIKWEATLE